MADPFITETDLVNHLGRGDASDPGFTIAVDSACDIVREYTEQELTVNEAQEFTMDGTGTDCLLIPQLPVNQIDSVFVAEEEIEDYVLRSDGALIRTVDTSVDAPAVASWPVGRQNVVINCRTGYAPADFPRSLMQVALWIAARIVVQGPTVQETIGQTSVRYAGAAADLSLGERIILRKYKAAR